MPRHKAVLKDQVELYLATLAREGKAQITLDLYRWVISRAMNALHEAGMNATPKTVGEEEIDFLRTELWIAPEVNPRSCRCYLGILGACMEWHGNNSFKRMRIPWPQDQRIHVDWLTPLQAVRLLEASQGLERILVHLELRCGLRRCEIMRLKLDDFGDSAIDVLGKGVVGGKPRTVPFGPKTSAMLADYLELRDAIIGQAPESPVPEGLMIYARKGRLKEYGVIALNDMLDRAADRAGVELRGHHTLRRTCGRIMYLSGVKVIRIMRIFGHATEEQTIRYLGLHLDEMSDAMQQAEDYLDTFKQEQKGPSQQHFHT